MVVKMLSPCQDTKKALSTSQRKKSISATKKQQNIRVSGKRIYRCIRTRKKEQNAHENSVNQTKRNHIFYLLNSISGAYKRSSTLFTSSN